MCLLHQLGNNKFFIRQGIKIVLDIVINATEDSAKIQETELCYSLTVCSSVEIRQDP